MSCLYNQNQSCYNMVCTGKDCLQHPQSRVKKLYKTIRDMYGASKPQCQYEDGQEYCKKQVLDIIEKVFPEVKSEL